MTKSNYVDEYKDDDDDEVFILALFWIDDDNEDDDDDDDDIDDDVIATRTTTTTTSTTTTMMMIFELSKTCGFIKSTITSKSPMGPPTTAKHDSRPTRRQTVLHLTSSLSFFVGMALRVLDARFALKT